MTAKQNRYINNALEVFHDKQDQSLLQSLLYLLHHMSTICIFNF